MPMQKLIALLLLFSAVSFGLGISLPIMRFEKFFFFEETPSLLTLIYALWSDSSLLLAIVVLLFSVVFPLSKLAITFINAFGTQTNTPSGSIAWIANALAKWSMMDVLLVALVIFAAKTSGLASAFTQAGLWFYASSAIGGAVATSLLQRHQSSKIVNQDGMQLPGS